MVVCMGIGSGACSGASSSVLKAAWDAEALDARVREPTM